ncbi:hypothetical protein FQZ97_740250 [compost metagenome]
MQIVQHLLGIVLVRGVVEQASEAHPGRRIARRDGVQQGLGGLEIRFAEHGVDQHPGYRVDPLRRHPAALVGSLQLSDQGLLLFTLLAPLVDRGQFDVADILHRQGLLADTFDLVEMLVVAALGPVQQHLRQSRLWLAVGAPLVDLPLRIDRGEGLRVLHVEQGQRQHRVLLAGGHRILEQRFSFPLLGLAGARLARQQPSQARGGAR